MVGESKHFAKSEFGQSSNVDLSAASEEASVKSMLGAVWHVRCTEARQGGARFQRPDQGEKNHGTKDGRIEAPNVQVRNRDCGICRRCWGCFVSFGGYVYNGAIDAIAHDGR